MLSYGIPLKNLSKSQNILQFQKNYLRDFHFAFSEAKTAKYGIFETGSQKPISIAFDIFLPILDVVERYHEIAIGQI
jgi:hypothetical protein